MSKEETAISKNSMLYWHPKLAETEIPMPETIIIFLGDHSFIGLLDKVPEDLLSLLSSAISEIGLPCFLRTDYFSAKHTWDSTCFIDSVKSLDGNIARLVDASLCRDLGANALIIREFLTLESAFTVSIWSNMPVAKERRYFVRNNEIICHHPYWDREIFLEMEDYWTKPIALFPRSDSPHSPLPDDWREKLEGINYESEEEIAILSEMASIAGLTLEGEWSIDFAHIRDEGWVLIDCALAKDSWHPPGREGSGIICKLSS